jgi:hypothetical protein
VSLRITAYFFFMIHYNNEEGIEKLVLQLLTKRFSGGSGLSKPSAERI